MLRIFSSGNQILDNSFQRVEGLAVFLEGPGNQVITRGVADKVRDLGEGNWVTVRAAGGNPGLPELTDVRG